MCIIVDINTITKLLDSKNKDHLEYRPVLQWIVAGKGKLVYGGTKYLQELSKLRKYTKLITILRSSGKVFEVDKNDVDNAHQTIQSKLNKKEFNDPHIIAIVSVSGCRLLCSGDKESFPFIKSRHLYQNKQKPPAIYQSSKNQDLLTDPYIADCCKPCVKGSRELCEYFGIA